MKMTHFISLLLYICPPAACLSAVTGASPTADTSWPVIDLSAQTFGKENNIVLKWKASGFSSDGFFSIERSYPDKEFEVIAVVKAPASQTIFEFMDEKPAKTRNNYRVKRTMSDKKTIYSPVISAGLSGGIFCRFYPNPVDQLLIVRADDSIELQITDGLSKIRVSRLLNAGLHLVDVSALEKGIYIISIAQKQSNSLIIEKLIKN